MKTLVYAPIDTIEKQDDGTLIVSGVASTETMDSDGEIVTADAMRKAIPDYMAYGAVREMHRNIAAGTAIGIEVGDDNVTRIQAHIVDEGSVKKVENKVLKGFSIYGPVLSRRKGEKHVVTGLKLTEVSLVDRPANPDARFTLVKFDADGIVETDPPAPKKLSKRAREKARAERKELAKGLYDVSRLADLIGSLWWLVTSAESEAATEGDGSQVPVQLRAMCTGLVTALRDMVDEETAELLGIAKADASLEGIAKACDAITADEVSKAGAKFSSNTKKQLGVIHDAMLACCDKMDSLGYKGADNPEDQDMTDTEKTAADAALAKANAEIAELKGIVAKSAGAKEKTMEERLTDLEGSLAASRKETADAVKKAADATAQTEQLVSAVMKSGVIKSVKKSDDSPIAKAADGTPDAKAEFRAAFAKPMSPIGRLGR